VKGKAQGIDVYELLGQQGAEIANLPQIQRYEAAFDAYLSRDFKGAAAILAPSTDDPPSAILHARCQQLEQAPPPADWDGVHVAVSK
jgi:adenylate cyclase